MMSSTNKQHEEANQFALDLLMPEDKFRAKVDGGMKNIGELAEYFGVSAMAVRHRARTLGMKGHGLTKGYRNIEK
jgi:Zn-dependent peptidase ImmA (M78 family)